jgi:Uma2 family endonuclease
LRHARPLLVGIGYRQFLRWTRKSPVEVYNDFMGTEVISKLTYKEFRQLPDDGKRYELIHGEVHLSPSPSTRHQLILLNLSLSLGTYMKNARLGVLAFAPLDVCLNPDTALQPDLIFISAGRAGIVHEDFVAGAPDLAVEILSRSTAAHDRATKLPLYAEAGVAEIWLVDPQVKTVEVLRLQGRKYVVDSTLAGHQTLKSATFPGWELPLPELFSSSPLR